MWFSRLAWLAIITTYSACALPAGGTAMAPPTQGQIQGQGTATGAGTGAGTGVGTGAGTGAGTGVGTGAGTEVGTGAGTGVGTGAGAGTGMGTATGTGQEQGMPQGQTPGLSQTQPQIQGGGASGLPTTPQNTPAAGQQQAQAGQFIVVQFPTKEVTWLKGSLKINPAMAQQKGPAYFTGGAFNNLANIPLSKLDIQPSDILGALAGAGGHAKRITQQTSDWKPVPNDPGAVSWMDPTGIQCSRNTAVKEFPSLIDTDKIKSLLHLNRRDLAGLDKRGLWSKLVDAASTIWSIINPFHCKRCRLCLIFLILDAFSGFPFLSTLCSVACNYAWSFWTSKCDTWFLNPAGVKYGKEAKEQRKKLESKDKRNIRSISGREIITIGSAADNESTVKDSEKP